MLETGETLGFCHTGLYDLSHLSFFLSEAPTLSAHVAAACKRPPINDLKKPNTAAQKLHEHDHAVCRWCSGSGVASGDLNDLQVLPTSPQDPNSQPTLCHLCGVLVTLHCIIQFVCAV